MAHSANQLPATAWGEARTVSAWFTAYTPSTIDRQPVHIAAGSEIRIRDAPNRADVLEIATASRGILRAHRHELDGRTYVKVTVEGISVGGGVHSRAAESGSFSTRGIEVHDFVSKMRERGVQPEVTVTRPFVANNTVSASGGVPLQRGARLVLLDYRAAEGQVNLALAQQDWSDQAHLHAAASVVGSTCLPTAASMAHYRTPLQAVANPPTTSSTSYSARAEIGTHAAQASRDDLSEVEDDARSTYRDNFGTSNATAYPVSVDENPDQQMAPVSAAAAPPSTNQIVAALQALKPNGSFDRPLLTRDELRSIANVESRWTLQELQYRLASMAQENFTAGFGSGQLSAFMNPVNINQLLPVYDPRVNPNNEMFTSKNGRLYVMGRVMSSAQGRVVHQGQSACTQCQKVASTGWGRKRYCQCVTVVDAGGNAILGGACSNCAHNDHPEGCSFYTAD